jgi:V/A-type H+/Na+-transporting ATPase subunit E
MEKNKENLEGIVSKIKEQGINAGEQEKQRIIESARKQAEQILSEAKTQSTQLIEFAKEETAQLERNSQTAITQASRDMLEATRTAILNYLKSVFAGQCESLFTQKQYLENLLKLILETVAGDKTVEVPRDMLKDMEAYLLKQATKEDIIIKPLSHNEAKIVVTSNEKEGLQYVLSAEDLEEGMFSLLNKNIVERITQKQEA